MKNSTYKTLSHMLLSLFIAGFLPCWNTNASNKNAKSPTTSIAHRISQHIAGVESGKSSASIAASLIPGKDFAKTGRHVLSLFQHAQAEGDTHLIRDFNKLYFIQFMHHIGSHETIPVEKRGIVIKVAQQLHHTGEYAPYLTSFVIEYFMIVHSRSNHSQKQAELIILLNKFEQTLSAKRSTPQPGFDEFTRILSSHSLKELSSLKLSEITRYAIVSGGFIGVILILSTLYKLLIKSDKSLDNVNKITDLNQLKDLMADEKSMQTLFKALWQQKAQSDFDSLKPHLEVLHKYGILNPQDKDYEEKKKIEIERYLTPVVPRIIREILDHGDPALVARNLGLGISGHWDNKENSSSQNTNNFKTWKAIFSAAREEFGLTKTDIIYAIAVYSSRGRIRPQGEIGSQDS